MTKVRNNPLLQGASGKLGNTIVYKNWQGQVLMTNMPSKRRFISDKQKAMKERFREATHYAKCEMKDPESKAEYKKGITLNKNAAFRVAVSDFLNPPEVHYIKVPGYSGAIGEMIRIKATDDFKVIEVRVSIIDATGKVLERGNASPSPRKRQLWRYITTVTNENVNGTVIKVTAYDKPRNEGKGELVIESISASASGLPGS
ncbi:MAG TPA: hypothetical protein PLR06_02825 [Cyclobacteriaceae bacterium]|nr:hypothetical protein [Cyclobacteriaceae bacterium]